MSSWACGWDADRNHTINQRHSSIPSKQQITQTTSQTNTKKTNEAITPSTQESIIKTIHPHAAVPPILAGVTNPKDRVPIPALFDESLSNRYRQVPPDVVSTADQRPPRLGPGVSFNRREPKIRV
jgi:hypothetical protein